MLRLSRTTCNSRFGKGPTASFMNRRKFTDVRRCLMCATISPVAISRAAYETFDGNRADVSTMEGILRMVERKYGKARRIWVMDRGIVSEENLAAIRKRGGQYLVGTPRSQMKQFAAELLKDDWIRVRPEVEVKKVVIPQGEETFILCRTDGRKEKEKAIRNRFSNRMEDALKRLALD